MIQAGPCDCKSPTKVHDMQQVARVESGNGHVQVLGFPEDIFEEAALVAESPLDTSSGSGGGVRLAPHDYVSSGLVAHALTQLAAGKGAIKLGNVKVSVWHMAYTIFIPVITVDT